MQRAYSAALNFLRRHVLLFSTGTVVLAGLFWVGRFNYLLFHVLAELFAVVIAFTIFLLTWNIRRYIPNGYLVFLGISFLFTGVLDMFHTLAFRGMGVFPGTGLADPDGANLATQLWIAARYMQSISLLLAPLFLRRPVRPAVVLPIYTAITALLLLSIFTWRIFPDALLDTVGLTTFKKASEYIIIFIFAAGALALYANREAFDEDVLAMLLLAAAIKIFSEMAFLEYLSVFDIYNQIGHILKIVAFYFIYKAIIETGFLKPQALMFRELGQRERALRMSEARERERAMQLEAIMDAVPAVVWITQDTHANMVTGNRASYEILRMEYPENLSKTAPEGKAPGHFRVLDKEGKELKPDELPLQVSAATGEPVRDFEEIVVFEDGEERCLFGNVTPILDPQGQPTGAVGAFIDITARVRAEEAYQQSEARLHRLVDANIIGIMYLDRQGQVVEANDAFLNLTGYSRVELEAGQVNWVRMTPEIYHPLDERALRDAVERGACDTYEKELLRKDGSRVPILTGFTYLGEVEAPLIAFLLDLTRQKRAEASAREYAAQMERINRDLARANEELQDFAFVASHDLQEPLRKIQAFGERLRDRLEGRLDEDQHDYLLRMLSAANRMSAMINDLLALSRVTTRGQPFQRVDLNSTMNDVVSDLEVRIERTGGRVTFDNLPVIQADPIQMHQLMQNLVGNALKFHLPGVQPQVRIWSELDRTDDCVKIFVEDNGVGFDETYLDRIFMPFQRLHGRGEYEGSGIGLAVCRKIIERHHGTITAHSTPEKGATFIVSLPLEQVAESETGSGGRQDANVD